MVPTLRTAVIFAGLVQACHGLFDGVSSGLKTRKGDDRTQQLGQCKTLCQRFGMQALANQFSKNQAVSDAFAKTTGDPTSCCKVCDQTYPVSGAR
mmetsp:Transcript_55377/g.140396  ORF Transcript_55377/g.140396 Transcript_55377/m.140396 type:complete len:95 (+) Transcript_55377:112-396(+)